MVRIRYARPGGSTHSNLFSGLLKKATRLRGLTSRKSLAVVAALGILASPLVGVASPATAAACVDGVTGSFSGGAGTFSNPWKISTPAQLRLLDQPNDTSCLVANRYFLQTANIDLSSYPDWTPIGTLGGTVSSNFDGGNFLITGLTITTEHASGNALFANMNGTVTRVHLIAPNISGGGRAAGIATLLGSLGFLTNSSVQGGSISGANYVGGLVGSLYGTINNSWSSAAVNASTEAAGGLAGWALYNSRVSGSYSTGTATSPRRQGGLFGMTYDNGQTNAVCEISSSYSAAKASTPPSPGGGIMGEQWCFSSFSSGQSFWDSELSGLSSYKYSSSSGNGTPVPVGKTTAQMKDFATFGPTGAAWKISNGTGTFNSSTAIWGICTSANGGYPFLLWQDSTGKACLTPDRPTSISAAISDGSASVSWLAPSAAGASSVASYTVTSYPGERTCIATAPNLSCSVTGLTNGTSYTFGVTATNASGTGWSGWSNSGFIPLAPPTGAITGTPFATAGDASAVVSWTNTATSGVTGYLVTANPGGRTCTTAMMTCTVTGLTNGTPHTFTVKKTNSAGASPTSSTASEAVTPLGAPDAPGAPTVSEVSNSQATLSWVAPVNNGGSSVTEYTVTSTPGSLSCTVTVLTCTLSGLTNGEAYTFTVKAKNSINYGAESVPSTTATPRTTPGTPTSVTGATVGDSHVVVQWAAPTSNGGADITEYQVRAYDGADISRGVCTVNMPAALSCDVTGLTNGVPYTFGVIAYNSAGYGTRSTVSTAYTPLSKPGAPTAIHVLAGDESALVTWMPPTNTGGAALTSFTATSNPGSHTCTATAPSTICYVPGLTNGQAYTFTVTARSAAFATVGESNASIASDSVTPLTTPGAPTFTSLTPGNGYLAASFSPPTSDGGSAITRYDYSVDNGANWIAFGSVSTSAPQRITGLSTGVSYDVLIRAVNEAGAGPSTSAQTATFVTAPAAPSGVTGVAGDNGVALAWTAPTMTGGRALVSYTATALPGGASCTVLAPITTCDITGLTNGVNYTFTVTATNTIGTSTPSLATAAMKPISPAASNVTFEIVIAVVVGDPVAGGSAEFSSTGLEPSSPWDLVVRSTPRVLSSGTSGAAGTILGNAVIPTGLEAGWHSLTLSGRNYLGYQVSSTTWFEINASGELMGASSIDPKTLEQNRLAQTGQATREIALLAFALMAVGFVLTRRRTRQTT